MLIKGANLTSRQREMVLATFVNRWTVENQQKTYNGRCPACEQSRRSRYTDAEMKKWHAYHEPMTTDEKWLAAHAFHFVANGSRLMANRQHAEPHYLAD